MPLLRCVTREQYMRALLKPGVRLVRACVCCFVPWTWRFLCQAHWSAPWHIASIFGWVDVDSGVCACLNAGSICSIGDEEGAIEPLIKGNGTLETYARYFCRTVQ